MKIQHLWVLALVVLLIACNNNKTTNKSTTVETKTIGTEEVVNVSDELKGIWTLRKLDTTSIKNTTSYKNPTMEIDPSTGEIKGNSGCNKYSGSLKVVAGNQITIEVNEMTETSCPEANLEGKYIDAITAEDLSYELNDKELILHSQNTTLVYEKAK